MAQVYFPLWRSLKEKIDIDRWMKMWFKYKISILILTLPTKGWWNVARFRCTIIQYLSLCYVWRSPEATLGWQPQIEKNKQTNRLKYKRSGANRNTNTISLPLLCEGHQKPHKGANKTPPPVEWKLHRHIGYLSNPSWPSHLWNKLRVSSTLKGGWKHRLSSILKYLWVN